MALQREREGGGRKKKERERERERLEGAITSETVIVHLYTTNVLVK